MTVWCRSGSLLNIKWLTFEVARIILRSNSLQRLCHRQHRLSTLNPVAQQCPADQMTLCVSFVLFLFLSRQDWDLCERTSSTATLSFLDCYAMLPSSLGLTATWTVSACQHCWQWLWEYCIT